MSQLTTRLVMKPALIIPARMASERLPAKALKDIAGKSLVQHVWTRAMDADLGPVYVATDHISIAEEVNRFGGEVIMTDASLPTGSDRVAQAFLSLEEKPDVVINLQGDLPLIDPKQIKRVLEPLEAGYDVGTLVTFMDQSKQKNPSYVKAIVSAEYGESVKRCHWFCRAALDYGHFHLGVYAYTRAALQRFADTAQHPLELQESLEQLRVLTLGMSLGAATVDSLALEVNTSQDLANVRKHFEPLVQ